MPKSIDAAQTGRSWLSYGGWRLALLTCGGLLLATLAFWHHGRLGTERQLRAEFDGEVVRFMHDLQARLAAYTRTLRAGAALFVASDQVTRRDWEEFVRSLHLEREYAALQALAYARELNDAELEGFVRRMRASGVADFEHRPPGRRERYVINTYTAPENEANRRALGYDMWQDAERRATMLRARQTGEPAITPRLTLKIDERGAPTPAFIIYLPVVLGPKSQPGYVLGPVRASRLIDDLIGGDQRGITVAFYDGASPSSAGLFHRSHAPGVGLARLARTETLEVGGRRWTLEFFGLPELERRVDDSHLTWILVLGGLFSVLAGVVAWGLANTRNRALALARGMTRSLRESEARLRTMIDEAPDAIIVYDADAERFVDANPRAVQLFGLTRDELMGSAASRFYPPGQFNGQTADENAQEMLGRALAGEQLLFDRTLRNARGEFVRCEMRMVRLPAGELRLVRVSFIDITERKRAEADLQVAAITFESQEGMLITDDEQNILRVNRSFTEITGYTSEDVVGKTPRLLKSGRHDAAFFAEVWSHIAASGTWSGELWNRRKSGEIFPVLATITAVRRKDGKVTNYVGTFIDITERRAAEDEIRYLAFYDSLTQLPNRRLMLERLRQALTASARHGRHGALMLFDLDDFKTLNDTLGHDIGDQFLREVAARLQACLRESDTVARLGGDEFVVILEELDSGFFAAMQAESVAVKIQSALAQPYLLDLTLAGGESNTRNYQCTSSIGITLFRGHDVAVEELLKRADTAMYQAKSAGRNTLRFFDPDMQAAVSARAALESDLRAALEGNQFILHYQAQVDADGRITGAEALVRWQHPRRGMLLPKEFIEQAEASRLIQPIGRWVLGAACRQLATWATQAGCEHLEIAVNVSSRQFHQADFVDQVREVLSRTGANPRRLKLELTESLLLHDVEEVVARMTALRDEGIRFSLDDFGTGYSSLYYLKRLPLAQLKIDQSFVRDVLTDANDAAIARTVIALGKSLGLSVIAEGVETAGQRDFLFLHGCHAFQGRLFGAPCPADEILRPLPA